MNKHTLHHLHLDPSVSAHSIVIPVRSCSTEKKRFEAHVGTILQKQIKNVCPNVLNSGEDWSLAGLKAWN